MTVHTALIGTQKMTREERRAQFGLNAREHGGGTTNAVKEKRKAFLLTRHSYKRRIKSQTSSVQRGKRSKKQMSRKEKNFL